MKENKHIDWIKTEFIQPKYQVGDIVETKFGLGVICSVPRINYDGLYLSQIMQVYDVYFGMKGEKTNQQFIDNLEYAINNSMNVLIENPEEVLRIAKNNSSLSLYDADIIRKHE